MDISSNEYANWPRFSSFVSADWIQGVTFKRYRRRNMDIDLPTLPKRGDTIEFVVLTPSPLQLLNKCDNCYRKHQPTNINCSMTMHRKQSFLDKQEVFYDFKSQQKISGKWTLDNVSTLGQSRLTIETWSCIG